jgi:DNA repair exonuclease SbcCD ATPase subunit
MENGDSANGEVLTRTLTREDSLYGDAFASPTKGEDSDRILPIEEDSSASDAAGTEAALHRLKEEKIALEKELEDVRRAQMSVATEASRLEGEVVRLQSDLFSAEAAAEAAEGEANKLKSESDSLNKALQVIRLRSEFMIGFNRSSVVEFSYFFLYLLLVVV